MKNTGTIHLGATLIRTIFIIPCIVAGSNGFAQKWQFGFKGGVSLPNLTSTGISDVSKGYKSISGPDLATVVDYRLSDKFSIQSGIEISTQGGKKSGVQTIPTSPELAQYFPPGTKYLYANFTSTVRLQYLMLPVLLKYTMKLGNSDNWKLYVGGGVFGALLTNADATASGSSKIYLDKEETQQLGAVVVKFDSTGSIKEQLHKGNFGVAGNLGLLYQMSAYSFFVEGGGNYGFVDLQKDSQNGINHTGALIFRIGFLFNSTLK